MGLVADLKSGGAGIRVALPIEIGWRLRDDREQAAKIESTSMPLELHAMASRAVVDLSPEHDDLLRSDAERCARTIFDDSFEYRSNEGIADRGRRRRTDDASWSPLIECVRVEVDGHPAQRSIHRVVYEPGTESIIGRLVIPVRRGSIELRAMAVTNETGYRESLVTIVRQTKSGAGSEQWPAISQADFDAIELDAQLPNHPLSRVRAQLDKWLEPGAISVVAPANRAAHTQAIQHVRFTIAPPPRTIASTSHAGRGFEVERFTRVELGTTEDSVLHWSVGTIDRARLRDGRASLDALRPLVEAMHPEARGVSWLSCPVPSKTAASCAALAEIDVGFGRRCVRFRALDREDHARFVIVYAHRGWSDAELDALLDRAQLDRDRE